MQSIKDLKEFATHGNSLLPLKTYSNYHEVEDLLVPYHWHKEIEIIYVEEGAIEVTINSEVKRLKKNELIFINSEELHQINRIGDNPSNHHALVFSPDLLSFEMSDYCQVNHIRPLVNQTLKLPQYIESDKDYSEKVLELFKEILNEYKFQEPGWYLNIKSCLYKILSIFDRNNLFIELDNDAKNLDHKSQQIKNVLTYIHENYEKKIYIEDLANIMNMNTQYFCRFFKKIIGKTPIEYINSYRINVANKYLQSEDIPIIDVCFRVGFENQSYFIKMFKKYNNMTPLEYKKIFLVSDDLNIKTSNNI
ncbi:AraC family transcriptional regulator [Romboutsia weinsteinii]|uniref:AraC family transcriptional regulator n=1 Tax=Romboutsia weinsteinii TaxID=2020949 RepID=A0A371J9J9_9FIRM|nr:AraC family transcriptional regulator [Romboutsia weinsteinii]RDY29415.1 AraC family transcriptional regulator [Romboutsia weinsteinii]